MVVVADLQKQRLSQLELEFETEQDVLIVEFDTEREMLVRQNQKELTELQDIIFAMEQEFAERENEAKNEFQSIRDELKNKVRCTNNNNSSNNNDNNPANKEPFLNQLARVILVHNWYRSTSICFRVYSRVYKSSACCHKF